MLLDGADSSGEKELVWTPGYCVSTIGLDKAAIREYVKNQEKLETHKQAQIDLPEFE